MNRREFLRTAGGAAGATTAATAATGSAAAQEGGGKKSGGGNKSSSSGGGGSASGPIDYGGWLEGAKGWGGTGSTADKTGKKEVTVKVGAGSDHKAFKPTAVHVSPGTKVTWEWVKGTHNVVSKKDKFKSGSPVGKAGYTFSHTFEKSGIYNYYCQPHKSMGMKGSVAVGSNIPHKSAAVAHKVEPHEMGVPLQAHYVGIATVLMMTTSLVFTFYTLKYGESAHTKGGNN